MPRQEWGRPEDSRLCRGKRWPLIFFPKLINIPRKNDWQDLGHEAHGAIDA